MSKIRIAVIGLGKAGLPLAAVIADAGFNVVGVDLNSERCSQINSGVNPIKEEPGLDQLIEKYGGEKLVATSNYKDAENCNVYIVLTPLFLNEANNPNFDNLSDTFQSLAKLLKKNDIVVLETTVPPMTTETMVRRWLEDESGLKLGDFHLAYSPERIMTGYSISRLKEFPKVIGGVDEESGRKAFKVYNNFIPNLHFVSSARTAEFIKVAEGCYRDVNIALANELFKIASELSVDFSEARGFANHKYCHIHLPSTGAGGHCVPIYPWFLIKEMEKRGESSYARLLRTSREVNDEMIEYWSRKIISEAEKLDRPLSQVKICVKGIAFRQGVRELYNSRNLALARLLSDRGLDVYVYDEMLTRSDVEELGLKWIKPEDADLIFNSYNLTMHVQLKDSGSDG